jgi:hypothetical protein
MFTFEKKDTTLVIHTPDWLGIVVVVTTVLGWIPRFDIQVEGIAYNTRSTFSNLAKVIATALNGAHARRPTAQRRNRWVSTWRINKWSKILGKRTMDWVHDINAICNQKWPWRKEVLRRLAAVAGPKVMEESLQYILLDLKEPDQYMIRDLLTYRAAAYTVVANKKLDSNWRLRFWGREETATLDYDSGVPFYDKEGNYNPVYKTVPARKLRPVHNRILNSFPARVFPKVSESFRQMGNANFNIPCTITDAIVLNFLALCYQQGRLRREYNAKLQKVCFLSREQIKEAMAALPPKPDRKTGAARRPSVWRCEDMADLAMWTMDCDLPWQQGSLADHIRRSREWHRREEEARQREHEEMQRQSVADREQLYASGLALPPVPLPEDKHLRFIDRYGDLVEEGRKQHHCVGSYADSAKQGRYFHFHVEYCGETATVQLNDKGQIVQGYGPCNQRNKASEYGIRVLVKWGKKFPAQQTVDPEFVDIEEEDAELIAL